MSQRRLGPTNPRLGGEPTSLHRCAIPFCSEPAVADNLCQMHHSSGPSPSARNGPGTGVPLGGSMGMSRGGDPYASRERWEDVGGGDRYRSKVSPMNLTLEPPRVAKKQKTASDVLSSMPSLSSLPRQHLHQYAPLTSENLHEREAAYGASTSSYGDSAYSPDPRVNQRSTTNSVQSESEQSGDADRETSLRRERNRIAARKSRQRKLDRISNLEEEKQRLEKHRDMLVQEIRSLEKRDAGVASNAVMTVTDKEYAELQRLRIQIIDAVEDAYNRGDIMETLQYFRDDSIVSGPQNSSVHLRGKDALVLDYLCTTYLFDDIMIRHVKVDSGGPRSQHFRVHWQFSGIVKSAGVSMNKDFLELIESVKGKRVSIEGVSNFSFSGDKIVYVHRTADQAKFLSALLSLSKQ